MDPLWFMPVLLQAAFGRKAAPSTVRPSINRASAVVVRAEQKAVAKVRAPWL